MLLRSGKPLVLAVNKCDKPGDPPAEFYEFYNLGLGDRTAFPHCTATVSVSCWVRLTNTSRRQTRKRRMRIASAWL